MQANALATLASQNPDIYKKLEVHKRLLKTIGIGDGDSLLNENPQQQNPQALNQLASVQAKQQDLQLKQQQQQREAAEGVVEAQMKDKELQMEGAQREADRQSHEKVALIHLSEERIKAQEAQTKAAMDREVDQHKILLEHKKLEQANAGQNQS